MLKYMPIYGSILLTIIILWIVASTFVGSRRKIRQAVTGSYIRSTCCGATTTPIGWTEEGWTSGCDSCGAWQYLGDDADNPPPGFNADGSPEHRFFPHQIEAMEEMTEISGSGVIDFNACRLGADLPTKDRGRIDAGGNVTWKEGLSLSGGIVSIRREELAKAGHAGWIVAADPSDGDEFVLVSREPRPSPEVTSIVADYRRAHPEIAAVWADEGEPLAVPPPPNIGGEDHPDYQGPHYDSVHGVEARFAPYDMLTDPIPGTAVHKVGSVAMAGPLSTDREHGDGEIATRREDGDES